MTKYDDDVFELIDGKRVLKDRARLRVPMTARDRRGVNPYLSDVQRAVATDAATRDARARAYELYDQEVGQAWRKAMPIRGGEINPPTGFGSHGPRGAVEGDACTINGAKGRLKLVNGALQCIPLRASSDRAQFTDGHANDPTALHRPGWRVPVVNDRRAVRDALQRYETQLVNMYKVRDGQTQCPDCDGSGVDHEDGGDCPSCDGKGTINNADRANDAVTHTQPQHHGTIDHRQLMDRLYAEHDAELSNAWRSK